MYRNFFWSLLQVIVLFCLLLFFFCCFSRRGYCCLATIVFADWVAVPLFDSVHHFYCHAIFIAAIHFIAVQPATMVAFHSKLNLSLPFLLWSRRPHIHFVAKDVFLVTVHHCSIGSNSPTVVVLSKPVSYSPALFSISLKRCEHAYQYFMVAYGTGKVRQLCGSSTLAGVVKVRD